MALETYLAGDRRHHPLARLAASTLDQIAAFYAGMARILIGRVEDIADFKAVRRSRRFTLAVGKRQVALVRTSRRRR